MKHIVFDYKFIWITGVVVLITATLFFIGLEKYTTARESYCMSCHYRQGYSEFWKGSQVHPVDVGCPECHADHNQFIPRSFSADAERININCVRCHKNIITDEQIGYKTNLISIRIPHELHIKNVGAQCTDCHYAVRHDRTPRPTNRPHMEACFSCHSQTKSPCEICHPLQHGFYSGSADLAGRDLPSTMYQNRVECLNCHGLGEKYQFLEIKGKCLACHQEAEEYYQIMLANQQEVFKKINDLEQLLENKKTKKLKKQEQEAVYRIQNKLSLIKMDGSKGVHNPQLVDAILEDLQKQLKSEAIVK